MTDDVNGNDDRQADPADALADLADRGGGEIIVPDETDEVDPLSALDAMSRGDAGATDLDEFAAAASETAAEDVSDEVFSGAGAPLGASGRTHVTTGVGYHRHHAHMYKKTIIPFMLVVGVMLVIVGFIAVSMVSRPETEQEFSNSYLLLKIVMYVSFPLAAVVLAGAWLFHRDVNK